MNPSIDPLLKKAKLYGLAGVRSIKIELLIQSLADDYNSK